MAFPVFGLRGTNDVGGVDMTNLPLPGRYRVRDTAGRLVGVLVVEARGPTPAAVIPPMAVAWAQMMSGGLPTGGLGQAPVGGGPATGAGPDGVVLVRWAGSSQKWTASADDLRRIGLAEPAEFPP